MSNSINSNAPANTPPPITVDDASKLSPDQQKALADINAAADKVSRDIAGGASNKTVAKDIMDARKHEGPLTHHKFSKADTKAINEEFRNNVTSEKIQKALTNGHKPDDKHIESEVRRAYHHYAKNHGKKPDEKNYAAFSKEFTKSLTDAGVSDQDAAAILQKASPSTARSASDFFSKGLPKA